MRTFASLLLFLCVLTSPFGAQGAEEYLWRAYTRAPGKKQDLLREAERRLKNLRLKASLHQRQQLGWPGDSDARWLLDHRIPTLLILDRELAAKPSGTYLAVLARLAAQLGSQRLARHLPELLPGADTDQARLAIITAMADLRGPECEAALAQFLKGCIVRTREDLISGAAAGLGRSRDKKYLPLLKRVAPLVGSELGELKLAAARYLCGEEEAATILADVLARPDADPMLHAYAVEFFSRNPVPQAVQAVGRFAEECPDERLAMRAIDALIGMTGFGVPSTKRWAELSKGQETDEETERLAALLPPPKDGEKPRGLTREERSRLVRVVLEWWSDQPEESRAVRRHLTRSSDALKAENAPPN